MKWYASTNADTIEIGPFRTRKQAIRAGQKEYDEDFYVMQAKRKPPIKLGNYFRISDFIDRLQDELDEDGVFGEDSGGLSLSCKDELSLQADIRIAINKWQRKKHIKIVPWTLEHLGPAELIAVQRKD